MTVSYFLVAQVGLTEPGLEFCVNEPEFATERERQRAEFWLNPNEPTF